VIRHNLFAGKAVTSPNILVYPAYPERPMGGFREQMWDVRCSMLDVEQRVEVT
jgi:hypothetical protein